LIGKKSSDKVKMDIKKMLRKAGIVAAFAAAGILGSCDDCRKEKDPAGIPLKPADEFKILTDPNAVLICDKARIGTRHEFAVYKIDAPFGSYSIIKNNSPHSGRLHFYVGNGEWIPAYENNDWKVQLERELVRMIQDQRTIERFIEY
jgi:hypothetical protein